MSVPADCTILVLEQDSSLRQALERLLRRHGWGVVTAGSVREALQRLACDRGEIRLALVDLSPGAHSGMSLVRHLYRRPAGVRVLGFASGEDWSALGESRALGVCEVLTKPAAPDVIVRAVRSALGMAERGRDGLMSSAPDSKTEGH
jgi:DNA-binding NtrC family response regulator